MRAVVNKVHQRFERTEIVNMTRQRRATAAGTLTWRWNGNPNLERPSLTREIAEQPCTMNEDAANGATAAVRITCMSRHH